MRVPYTKRTYEEIRKEIVRQIPELTDKWTDFNLSDPGILILDALAAIADMLNFSIDRNMAEFFISTMTRRTSATRLAALVGYKLRRVTPSLVMVRFSVAEPWPNDITIGKWTTILGNNSVPFLTLVDATLSAGSLYVDVPCAQVERLELNFISSGKANQRFELGPDSEVAGDFSGQLLDLDLDFKATEVYVDGELWERVDSFIDNPENAYVEENKLEKIYVTFGDGVFGRIPPEGASLRIVYYRTLGSAGNLPKEAIKGDLTLRDVMDRTVGVQYEALENATGGEDREELDEARRNIPNFVRYTKVLTTRDSWRAAMLQFPGVLLANAWGEEYEDPPNFRMFNVVRFTFVPTEPEWTKPSSALVAALKKELDDRKEITLYTQYVEPEFVEIDLDVEVRSLPTASASVVENDVRGRLQKVFAWGAYDFNAAVHHSDLVRVVEETQGVSHCFLRLRCPAKGIDDFACADVFLGLNELPKLRDLRVACTPVNTR